MVLRIGIGGFSGAISPNDYRTQDSPRYIIHGRKRDEPLGCRCVVPAQTSSLMSYLLSRSRWTRPDVCVDWAGRVADYPLYVQANQYTMRCCHERGRQEGWPVVF